MKIKKYQQGNVLTGYDKEIADYTDWVKLAEPKIQQRRDAFTEFTSGEKAMHKSVAKKRIFNTNITESPEDNFAIQWMQKRIQSRPDLVTEDNINYIKDRLSTLSYLTPQKNASTVANYISNKGKISNAWSKFPDIYKDRLYDFKVDDAIKNGISPEDAEKQVLKHWEKNEKDTGKYWPSLHMLIVNPYVTSKRGQYPFHLAKLHEEAHSWQLPFLKQVSDIAKKYNINADKEKNFAKEIYSRLMTFRKDYDLDPAKKYTLDDVQQWKQMWRQKREDDGFGTNPMSESYHNHGLLWDYSDNMVLDLVNGVASNNRNSLQDSRFQVPQFGMKSQQNGISFARNGSKLHNNLTK